MVQAVPTFLGRRARRRKGGSLAPNSNHKDKLLKTGHILHSFRNQKGENKANSLWLYKNVNYLNTVLLWRNLLAETEAMPVQ